MVHPCPGHAPVRALRVHGELVPVLLGGRAEAEGGEASQRGAGAWGTPVIEKENEFRLNNKVARKFNSIVGNRTEQQP